MCIGCHIHDGCINSLSYADDMVLLTPSTDALQDIINVCQVYAAKHDIVYRSKVNSPELAHSVGVRSPL